MVHHDSDNITNLISFLQMFVNKWTLFLTVKKKEINITYFIYFWHFQIFQITLLSVFKAAVAATSAGSAFARSFLQSVALISTSALIWITFFSSSSAVTFSFVTFSVSAPTIWISLLASSFLMANSTSWAASLAFRSSTWRIKWMY